MHSPPGSSRAPRPNSFPNKRRELPENPLTITCRRASHFMAEHFLSYCTCSPAPLLRCGKRSPAERWNIQVNRGEGAAPDGFGRHIPPVPGSPQLVLLEIGWHWDFRYTQSKGQRSVPVRGPDACGAAGWSQKVLGLNSTAGHTARRKHNSKGCMHPDVHCSTIYSIQSPGHGSNLNVHQQWNG